MRILNIYSFSNNLNQPHFTLNSGLNHPLLSKGFHFELVNSDINIPAKRSGQLGNYEYISGLHNFNNRVNTMLSKRSSGIITIEFE